MATIDEMIAQMQEAYSKAEATAPQQWYPPDGTYSAVVSDFTKEVRTLRKTGEEYLAMTLEYSLTAGEFTDKQTSSYFNNLPTNVKRKNGTTEKVYFRLNEMKSAAQVLNDGEIDDNISSTMELLQASANAKTPVHIKVSTRKYKDKQGAERSVSEIAIVDVGS